MISSVATAGFGFIFWILNARLFSTREVGIATAIISTAGFISEFSLLGLKNALIRYLPKSLIPNIKINTALNIVAVVSILLTSLFLIVSPYFSKDLAFLNRNLTYILLLLIFLVSFSINQIQEGIFVAYRSTEHILIKNILWGFLKISLPLILLSYGAMGIFISFSTGCLLSVIYGFIILKAKYKFTPLFIIDKQILRTVGKFSLGNYIGSFISNTPYFMLPLILISKLGAEEAAFYYIAMQIASILLIVPSAVNQSLFAEGSHDEAETKTHLIGSIKLTFALLIPLIVIILTLGKYVLLIFGKHYSDNGLGFLQLMAFSGIFSGINQVGHALLHVEKKIKMYVTLNAISAVITIFLATTLLHLGLVGVGVAFLCGTGAISAFYLFILREKLR